MTEIESVWPPQQLLTRRLELRPTRAEDRVAYIELLSPPSVWEYLGGARSREELEGLVPEVPGNHPGVFAVADDGQFIGTVVLDYRDAERPGHVRPGGNELEISYTFLPSSWGRGLASEAVEAVLDWTATALAEQTVVLCTQTANAASARLAERLGFREISRFEEFGSEQWLGVRSL
jgi:RimJ/RimL family protein N-acetyltransferase